MAIGSVAYDRYTPIKHNHSNVMIRYLLIPCLTSSQPNESLKLSHDISLYVRNNHFMDELMGLWNQMSVLCGIVGMAIRNLSLAPSTSCILQNNSPH